MLPMIEKIWFTPGFVTRNPPELQLVRESFAACPREGYARACEALGAADLRPLAARITAPTMVMCGVSSIEVESLSSSCEAPGTMGSSRRKATLNAANSFKGTASGDAHQLAPDRVAPISDATPRSC